MVQAKFFAIFLLTFTVMLDRVHAADPDPLTDFVSSPGFSGFPPYSTKSDPDPSKFVVRNVFKNGDVSDGPGGLRSGLTTSIFPAMDTQGLTYVHFRMKPCGVNLPHTHPRATEFLTMVSGGPIQAGFVDTEGKAHINLLYPGDVTIFPRGMLHFEINVGSEPAFFISALNSQNPGTLTSGGALFNVPTRALASALNQEIETVSKIKDNIHKYGSQLVMAPVGSCIPGKDLTTSF